MSTAARVRLLLFDAELRRVHGRSGRRHRARL